MCRGGGDTARGRGVHEPRDTAALEAVGAGVQYALTERSVPPPPRRAAKGRGHRRPRPIDDRPINHPRAFAGRRITTFE